MRLCLFRPGKLVDGKIYLIAPSVQLGNDALVTGSERIECSREESYGLRSAMREGKIQDSAADKKTIQSVENRRLCKAVIFALPRFLEKTEQLFADTDAAILLPSV